jgi:hypothetical protein
MMIRVSYRVRRTWRARCRLRLARHEPVKLIERVAVEHFAATSRGLEWGGKILSSRRACANCGRSIADDGSGVAFTVDVPGG